MARLSGNTVRMFTRNGNNWTAKMTALVDAIKQLGLRSAWLDGEIVVMGKNNVPSFQALQNAFDTENTASIEFFLFDLPYFDGHDLSRVPLVERRKLLQQLLATRKAGPLNFSEDFNESPDHILDTACKLLLASGLSQRPGA